MQKVKNWQVELTRAGSPHQADAPAGRCAGMAHILLAIPAELARNGYPQRP